MRAAQARLRVQGHELIGSASGSWSPGPCRSLGPLFLTNQILTALEMHRPKIVSDHFEL